ncbi:hypothetical protein GY982_25375, partial [Escherichia coli]|nr:hypothetical protein [Escherichia coli]
MKCLNYVQVSRTPSHSLHWNTLRASLQHEPEFEGKPQDVTEENIQSRVRGTYLMAFSNKFGYLLCATGNKSEMA